jgi:hypothetical protein
MKYYFYSPELHKKALLKMIQWRGLPDSSAEDLPNLGYIAFDGKVPACAGFVRKVEGGMGMVDAFITNPDVCSAKRSEALEQVFKFLLEACKALKINRLTAFSVYDNFFSRLDKYGAVEQKGYKFKTLTIK